MNLAGYGRHKGLDWFVMGNVANGSNYKDAEGTEILGTGASAHKVLAKFGTESEGHRLELGLESSRDDGDRLIKENLSQGELTEYPLEVSRDTVKLFYTTTASTDVWDPEVFFYFSQYEYWRPNYASGARGNNGDVIFNEEQFGGKVSKHLRCWHWPNHRGA